MADIKLFNIKGKVEEYQSSTVTLEKELQNVIENNMEQFAMDASRGNGETLETIAGILDVDSKKLGIKAQQHFAYLFANENVEAVDLALKIMELANA